MTSFKKLENQVEFKLEESPTWGVVKGKFGRFSIPVALREEDASKISDLAEENGAKKTIYGGTIYLKVKGRTDKHKKELLNKGKMNIQVYFKFTGVYTRDDTNYLIHKVSRLRKLEKPTAEVEDDTPED